MSTDFEELIPKKVLFSIKEIADLGIIKSDLCKKLIYNRQIEVVKLEIKILFQELNWLGIFK